LQLKALRKTLTTHIIRVVVSPLLTTFIKFYYLFIFTLLNYAYYKSTIEKMSKT
jgi:hypothetical protein